MRIACSMCFVGLSMLACVGMRPAAGVEGGYAVVKKEKVGGEGGFDYVYADSEGRKLYVPRTGARGNDAVKPRVSVFDLDTLAPLGEIANTPGVHGVAVDPKSGHGFTSSAPVVMFDTKTLATIKTIKVEGRPDGIMYEPATESIYVLSHESPNVTVIDAKDGDIKGTLDLGGEPEQGQSDGAGHVYIDLEDKSSIAVVDAKAMKVTAHYELGGKAEAPAGLALDAKNHVLFALCREPATCVVLSADDGKILATLPIGAGTDGGTFNPDTLEAFSSQGDGTVTVIKEKSPTEFEVEQTVQTARGAKTCTLDAKTGKLFLITAEYGPAPATQPQGGRRARGQMVPGSFSIIEVGK